METSNLTVQNINGQLVIDSRIISEGLGIDHSSFKKTISRYQADFEAFGTVSLESSETNNGGRPETFYWLNEDQSYLALTYSNNTPQVRQLKINLIRAFKVAREALQNINQPQLPKDYLSALKALVASEEEKQQLALQAAEQEAKIAVLAYALLKV